MRGMFGLVALVIVLALVGVLAKKQTAATTPPAVPDATVRGQSQQVQQQIKQQMDAIVQQPRPVPDE
ncbi:MAG: hypothetical protein QM569_13710 [Acidovorax sp.]|uniref:hypothetical protein n=1 Tax=Acidovorax sp. TaxID=1872122 RepID=UPI0039E58385